MLIFNIRHAKIELLVHECVQILLSPLLSRWFSSYDGVTSRCSYSSVSEARKVAKFFFTLMVGQMLLEMNSKFPFAYIY